MRIDHVGLYANDIEAMKRFYTTYFGAAADAGYHNPRTGFRSYFLTFEGGARLELMNRPDIEDMPKPPARTGFIHIAICVGGRDAVDALASRLAADRFTIAGMPRVTGDGYYECVALDPEGNQVEVTA